MVHNASLSDPTFQTRHFARNYRSALFSLLLFGYSYFSLWCCFTIALPAPLASSHEGLCTSEIAHVLGVFSLFCGLSPTFRYQFILPLFATASGPWNCTLGSVWGLFLNIPPLICGTVLREDFWFFNFSCKTSCPEFRLLLLFLSWYIYYLVWFQFGCLHPSSALVLMLFVAFISASSVLFCFFFCGLWGIPFCPLFSRPTCFRTCNLAEFGLACSGCCHL